MKIAYFDCFAGASGDMLLGALVDAGLPLDLLREQLRGLPLEGFRLEGTSEHRGPMTGTKISVLVEPAAGPRRSLADIEALLTAAQLPPGVVRDARQVFRRLAAVEARIHGIPAQEVHFHEVGATDALVDVVGALLGLELLGVQKVYCSPLPAGGGVVHGGHGPLPLPAPATLGLLAEVGAPVVPAPVAGHDIGELVTPTAAAILTTVTTFRQPAMALKSVGYGLGTRDDPRLPNVLRLWLGEEQATVGMTEVQVLETNIDDMNPELYGYVAERLFAEGALDVWYNSIQMKKNRPGTQLNVLAYPEAAPRLVALILQETSTLGVRTHILRRWEAEREVIEFESSLGPASVKIKRWEGRIANVAPEYEACRALAQRHNLPLGEVYRRVEAEGWTRLVGETP